MGYPKPHPKTTRRNALLGGAGAIGTTLGWPGTVSAAVPAPRSNRGSGPHHTPNDAEQRVFLDYAQQELDRAYDQFYYAPRGKLVLAEYERRSAEVREKYSYKTYSYGSSQDENLDVFVTNKKDAPINIFVHGGAWKGGSKDYYSSSRRHLLTPAPTT